MPSNEYVERLTNVAQAIRSIDHQKVTRPTLGVASLEEPLQPRMKVFNHGLSLTVENASELTPSQIAPLVDVFEAISNEMTELADMDDSAEYIQQSRHFLQQFDAYLEQLKEYSGPVIIAAIQRKGLLEEDGIKTAHDEAVNELKIQASKTLEEIQEKSEESIEKARKLAEQIENRARQTAAKISVKEAQSQFQEAQKQFDSSVKIWSIISCIPITLFLTLGVYLWNHQGPSEVGSAIYETGIRFAILGSLGALSAFCLRILRAHIHMRQQNLHRQRVANSIEAFVQSAVTPEQRDLILSYLVHSIIVFGNSGLVQEREESVNPSHLAIDSINRTFKYSESDKN